MVHDLRFSAYGLTTPEQWRINEELQRLSNGKLSLRKIESNDPAWAAAVAHTPPHLYGVWEERVARGEPNWVFMVPEMSIDSRILARIAENDFAKAGASKRMAKLLALQFAEEVDKQKRYEEQAEARREEMIGLGKIMEKRSVVTHVFNGEKYRIGDRVVPVSSRPIR